MDKAAEGLKARTKQFACAVLDFVDTLPRTPSGDAVARQLARSGLGTAGNYRGACRARSHTEFTARLGVVLEACTTARIREHGKR
jgi:four helix bundle protein